MIKYIALIVIYPLVRPNRMSKLLRDILIGCASGVIVALLVFAVHEFEFVRKIDRPMTDQLMKWAARAKLAKAESPIHLIFINVDEATCQSWTHLPSCNLETTTPRNELADIIEKLAQRPPAVVVLDIDLAPINTPPAGAQAQRQADDKLEADIRELAKGTNVILARPLVYYPGDAVPTVEPSILDGNSTATGACNATSFGAGNLWFASPTVEHDTDGVVREVVLWQSAQRAHGCPPVLIPGVGFLASALLKPNVDTAQLGCLFRKAGDTNCNPTIDMGGRTYTVRHPDNPVRILFSLTELGQGAEAIPHSPWELHVISASEAGKDKERFGVRDRDLQRTAVIIGGSYFGSGDVHRTPIDDAMPGSLIHANAIRALLQGEVLKEPHIGGYWLLKLGLILLSAVIGGIFASLADLFGGHRPERAKLWVEILLLGAGTFVAFLAVILVTTALAGLILKNSGTVIGVMTPALFVALEGCCRILRHIEEWLEDKIDHRSINPEQWRRS